MSGLAQVLAHHRAVRSERCSAASSWASSITAAVDVAQVLDDGAAVDLGPGGRRCSAGSRAWSRRAPCALALLADDRDRAPGPELGRVALLGACRRSWSGAPMAAATVPAGHERTEFRSRCSPVPGAAPAPGRATPCMHGHSLTV
jgi:hypothetical protein